jgi:superfamily II DNA/RNA helicase
MKQRVPDVLVATPGRLVDLLENEGLDVMLRSLRVLVYDEADQCKYYQQVTTLAQLLSTCIDASISAAAAAVYTVTGGVC